jgi:nucleotide-binding universal stress UspA family protein
MYKKILVPVDGSATSKRGLEEAMRIATDSGGTIRLVHVVDELVMVDPEVPIYYQAMIESLRESGKATLAKSEAAVKAQGIPVQALLLETMGMRAADLIVEQATDWPADLIVMGTHGRRGLRRVVLGSDAELVIRQTTVPVMLLRSESAKP